jgi:hypothetical protein
MEARQLDPIRTAGRSLAVATKPRGRVDAGALAAALAARLSPVVPDGIVVRASGDDLVVRSPTLWSATDLRRILERGSFQRVQLASACHAALNHVQDFVIGELRRGWPSSDRWAYPFESGALLPLPGVHVESARVRLWFGDEGTPAVAFEPITARELLEPPPS